MAGESTVGAAMHVAVFADLEGAFGIWRRRQCHTGTREWQYGRECLTGDVNAVVQGCFDGGAQVVTVKDTHATGFNVLVRRLDRRARYVGGHYIRPTFFGAIDEYALVLYVAIHAASGTPDAFFPHTHYGIFSDVRLNGRRVCETELYGAYLGEHGVGVGFVSGEEVAVTQATDGLPWLRSVAVDKRRERYTDGEDSVRYVEQGRARLREVAAQAVRDRRAEPLRYPGELHFEAVFRTEALANRYNTWRFEQEGASVRWSATNMVEGFDMFNKLTFFPRRIYPIRGPLLSVLRRVHWLRANVLAPKPDREGAVVPPL